MKKICTTIKQQPTLLSYDFRHNLGTKDVIVQVYDPEGEDITDVVILRNTNRITLLYDAPPITDMRVVVIG